MKKSMKLVLFVIFVFTTIVFTACQNDSSEAKDAEIVARQQSIYQDAQPVHIYDYSIPRDIYQQVYDVTTTQVVATYTIIETITGETKYEGPSVGYALPADVSITNPLQGSYNRDDPGEDEFSVVIEQAEPNGLFSSKNTDGTWIMYVDLKTGEVYPVYTEHKVTTFPFIMQKSETGQWVRADNKPTSFKIEIKERPVRK
jgi:hypothetical protein